MNATLAHMIVIQMQSVRIGKDPTTVRVMMDMQETVSNAQVIIYTFIDYLSYSHYFIYHCHGLNKILVETIEV